jgi:hypothetical protein
MRKVLSFVLVLSLVLGSFGMAFAAPMSDVAGEDFEEAVNVLTQLGVINGYPDGTYRPDNIVTRAEMAVIVVSALGLADYANGTSSFSDMGGHWSNGFVAYATSLGVIAGYPDGTFKPDKTVSYDEAATMLVAALGYTPDSLVGTWPANYVTKAKTLGILDGIKSGVGGANRGDIAIMAYQTLDQNIGKTDKDGVWNATVLKEVGATKEFDNMLGRLGAEIYDPGAAEFTPGENDFIVIGDEESAINLKPYLGALVTAYESDDEIIAIKEVKSVALTGSYDASESEFETEDGVVYNTTRVDGDNVQSFLNGMDDGLNLFNADFDGVVNVKTSGKYIADDGLYSFSTWSPTTTFKMTADMVEELDEEDTLNSYDFIMNDDDEIDLSEFELVGVESLDDIVKDAIVTVYEKDIDITAAVDLRIAKVEVSTDVIEGTVTRVKGATNPIDYTVGGKVYSEVDTAKAWNAAASLVTIEAGNEVELYLDAKGEIFISEIVDADADLLGVILDLDAGSQGLNGADTKFELALADGTSKVFVADQDELEDDGVLTLGAPNAFVGAAGLAKGVLVEYAVDSDGLIVEINAYAGLAASTTAYNDEISKKGMFDSKQIADDAVIVITDAINDGPPITVSTTLEADDITFTTLDKVLGREGITKSVYSTDDKGKIDLLVIVGGGAIEDEVYGVINGWFADNSDSGYGFEMLIDGVAVEKEAKDKTGWGTTQWNAQIAAQVLYDVTYTDGVVTGLGAIPGANTFTSVTNTAVTLNGNVASYNDGGAKTITVLSDAIVYVLNDSGDFEKGRLSDIKVAVGDNKTVIFYALDDDAPGLASIILVK